MKRLITTLLAATLATSALADDPDRQAELSQEALTGMWRTAAPIGTAIAAGTICSVPQGPPTGLTGTIPPTRLLALAAGRPGRSVIPLYHQRFTGSPCGAAGELIVRNR